MALVLSSARPLGASRPGRCCTSPAVATLPDYGLGGAAKRAARRDQKGAAGDAPIRKWWDYGSATASVGRPKLQLKLVTIPQVSPGGGDGGSISGGNGGGGGGRGGGGNGGGGGGMRGFTYLFAALLFAGGMAAYIRKGSYTSLLFSTAGTILLLISASLLHHRSGKLLALATCLGLATVMGQRANRSGKVFPAGLVAILSALMTAGYARSLA